jgi:RimJ/RimL family protein N-acetyltransferase
MAHPGAEYWPLFDLRVRTPRLELRYPDDEGVIELARLAAQGVHDPDYMPFGLGWTDVPSPEQERNSLQYHWRMRADWKPDSWHLPLATICDGRIVGTQGMFADNFGVLRAAETGSWLGREFQGQGIGKEMRAAILHLLFEGLGARRANTAAWDDNQPSLGVTRALGYVENGDDFKTQRDKSGHHLRFKLEREDWERRRRDDVVIENLAPCLPMFGVESSE